MTKHVALCVVFLAGFAATSLATAQAVGAPPRARVSQEVMQSFVVKKVNPVYPQYAKGNHIQGEVELKVIVDKQGNVAHLYVVSGPEKLVPAAVEGVKQWKYRPYRLNGFPVEVETKVTVNFTLAE